MTNYDVIIIGGGPAGLTAGLYSARSGLNTLLLERTMFGGQIVNTPIVENYPGFPEGISGFDLASLMHQQATKYGLKIETADVTGIKPGKPHTVLTSDSIYQAGAVIIAAGSEHSKLNVPGEEKYSGHGVSYCATCDGFLFRDREVAVVGGGDTAITDSIELLQHASKVYLIHRRDQFRATDILQQKAFKEVKLERVLSTIVEEIIGEDLVSSLKLRNVKTNHVSSLPVAGVFVAVGIKPNSRPFRGTIAIDDNGMVVTDMSMATSVAGIFAAGDIRQGSPWQVATAVGDGTTAAKSAFKYLRQ
jgi:thioredoxin reductase (NADPH)